MELFKHQKEAVDFVIKNKGNAALWHDMGLGKTVTALQSFKQIRDNHVKGIKLIVFCPLSLIKSAWGEDIDNFFGFKWVNCHKKGFPEGFDVYICNYEMLLSKRNNELIQSLASKNTLMCVLDESSKIKNFKSKTAKELLRIKDKFICRVVMSATPAPNVMSEYWSQISFLGRSIFHDSFYAFRNHYFHLARGSQKMIPNGSFISREMAREIFSKGWKYEITEQKRKELKEWFSFLTKTTCKRNKQLTAQT